MEIPPKVNCYRNKNLDLSLTLHYNYRTLKNVIENTLVLIGFVSEHWLCSSSFLTSWAIGSLPEKQTTVQALKKKKSLVYLSDFDVAFIPAIPLVLLEWNIKKQHLIYRTMNRKLCWSLFEQNTK